MPDIPVSRQYRIFREEERIASLPRTFYEKICRFFGKTLKISPDKKTREKLQKAIDFSHLKLTPDDVSSMPLGIGLLVSVIVLVMLAINISGISILGYHGMAFGNVMIVLLMTMLLVYYLYNYPFHLKKVYEIDAGSEIVSFILYMSMHMRNTPNLEGAVKFAAENLTGNLSYEIRKLLWDVEIGNYLNVQDALLDYAKKWENNREFVESLEILIASLEQPGDKRLIMLDEAINVILNGNRENARHFNQNLKMPVMVVHALGIILPILGLVLFPIISIFLGVKSVFLFIGYDVILPLILIFVINSILETRPATFSKIDISENPEAPPKGRFRLHGNNYFPAWPIMLLVVFVISYLGFAVYVVEGTASVLSPVLLLGGLFLGFAVYYILLSKIRIKIRNETRAIEQEFSEALFQIGNQISVGMPLEVSLERSIKKMENLTIKQLFIHALKNMKNLGMTFSDSFFDKEYGATRYYPSKMIKTVMRVAVESAKKGVQTVSAAMLSISAYLKGIHQTQEEVRESFNETVSSLKFQAYFLSPFVSGVIVTMAMIIIQILNQLQSKLQSVSPTLGPNLLSQFNQVNVTPFEFILIVGIYLLETSFILSSFINGIESGQDPIGRDYNRGHILWVSFLVFVISLFVTLQIFAPLVVITG